MTEFSNLSATKRSPPEYAAKAEKAAVVVCEFEVMVMPKSRQVMARGNCVFTAVRRLKSAPCAGPFFGSRLFGYS